jgi:hypothetical protein
MTERLPDETTWITGKPMLIEDRGMVERVGTRADGTKFVFRYSVGKLVEPKRENA